jgi:hypothetical protein
LKELVRLDKKLTVKLLVILVKSIFQQLSS